MRIHRLIASAVFAATIAVSGASYAFETTSIGGTNADGSAKFQDPDQQDLNKTLGGLQFGVSGGSGNENQANASDRPPWELQPTPPMRSFYSSPMGGSSMFRPGQ